ncbi:carbohydrate-binding protein [Vibrio sp. WXL103]|uniref:carbohydrate-binding protein n=1 Tax=Vibrio sp. WXL103 TaxID=3450710 RepID=UPI003EC6AF18
MKPKYFKHSLIASSIAVVTGSLMPQYVSADTKIDINLDFKHTVGGISEFDREKFMVLHSANIESDWDGEEDKKDYLLNQLDTYFARETGSMRYQVGQVAEDPARTGYAHPYGMTTIGTQVKNNYKNSLDNRNWRQFEQRDRGLITAAQDVPFYPGSAQTNKGWEFTSMVPFGHSTGEFMGRFLRDYFGSGGNTGRPVPKYLELMNEPVWPLVDKGMHGGGTIDDIFQYHLSAANEVRKFVPDVKVGGFTTAFPELEKNNFSQWDERWKYFIDLTGDEMDFYSLHLYDLPAFQGGEHYRTGANIEATLDMIEGYSRSQGKERPFLISEYGAQVHNLKGTPYNPYRDWLNVASFNSMLMQFLERPDKIIKAVPFGPIKAEWGRTGENIPYTSRMMRQANEPYSPTGEWVWTDYIKFYELWSKVSGTRIETKQSNINIQADAYGSGNRVFVILNNLQKTSETVSLNILGKDFNTIASVSGQSLYLGEDDLPKLDSISVDLSRAPDLVMKPESTIILEYEFDSAISQQNTAQENKYYSDKFKQKISASVYSNFNINHVSLTQHGEATLRLGIGRDLDLSRVPTVKVNGTTLNTTMNYRGSDQADKSSFFGLLEIPIPYELISASNNIEVKFADDGGYISSVALQLFSFTTELERSFDEFNTSIVIEAQHFSNTGSMTGTDAGGYDGVNATDIGIDWVNGKDWVSYKDIQVPVSGYYRVNYLMATPNSDRTVNFFVDGDYKMTTVVPNTGSWSNYQSVVSQDVYISAGVHNFMLSAGEQTYQWNLDKFELIRQ